MNLLEARYFAQKVHVILFGLPLGHLVVDGKDLVTVPEVSLEGFRVHLEHNGEVVGVVSSRTVNMVTYAAYTVY